MERELTLDDISYAYYPHGVKMANGLVGVFKGILIFKSEVKNELSSTLKVNPDAIKKGLKILHSFQAKWIKGTSNKPNILKFYGSGSPNENLTFELDIFNLVESAFKHLKKEDASYAAMASDSLIYKIYRANNKNFINRPKDSKENNYPKVINNINVNSVLDKANKYADALLKSNNDSLNVFDNEEKPVNWFTLYNKILEDPPLAEKMGFIHTIFVKFDKSIEEDGEKEYDYEIVTENPLDNESTKPYESILLKKSDKYFNGPKDYLLSHLFSNKNIKYRFHDIFEINQDRDPKGIYMYYEGKSETAKSTINQIFEEKDINFYNILIEDETTPDRLHTLGIHAVEIEYPHSGNGITRNLYAVNKLRIKTFSAGQMPVPATIKTAEDEENTTNLLFAWTGENLSKVRKFPKNIVAQGGNIDVKSEFNDDVLLKEVFTKLISKKTSFIPSTNLTLKSGANYKFGIRRVTPLYYQINTIREFEIFNPEIDSSKRLELCVEDLNDFKNKALIDYQVEFPHNAINSPVIIAGEDLDRMDSILESSHHMIIYPNETRLNKRYIYIPEVTLENFREEGYMQPSKIISPENQKKENLEKFAIRCIALEKRSKHHPPKTHRRNKQILYLADPRAKHLNIYANDLFSKNHFGEIYHCSDAFKFSDNYYPNGYYHDTKVREFNALKKIENGDEEVVLNIKDSSVQLPILKNPGTYSFNIISLENSDNWLNNGRTELKVSYVTFPKEPTLQLKDSNPIYAARNLDKPNEWNMSYALKEIDTVRKSIWWAEFTKSYFIDKANSESLLTKYINQNYPVGDYRKLLFEDEFPHQIYVREEGSDDNLLPYSYPCSIEISGCIPNGIFHKDHLDEFELFTIGLSEEDILVARSENDEYGIYLNGKNIPLNNIDQNGLVCFTLKIFYKSNATLKNSEVPSNLENLGRFILSSSTDQKGKSIELKGRLSSRISIADYRVSPDIVFIHEIAESEDSYSRAAVWNVDFNRNVRLQGHDIFTFPKSGAKLTLSRPGDEIYLKTEPDPYFKEKHFKLFAESSQKDFLKHYLQELNGNVKYNGENKLGTLGNNIYNLLVPNNTKPTKPKITSDLLLLHEYDSKWKEGKEAKTKEHSTRGVVRVLLDNDFMLEGFDNKLAIVLGFEKRNSDDELLGEDITKMHSEHGAGKKLSLDNYMDWETFLLSKDLVVKRSQHPIGKYYPSKTGREFLWKDNFMIDGSIVSAVICQPFYNAKLDKYQVLLPLKEFEKLEAIFLNIQTFKIAYGHGLKHAREDEAENKVWIDTTGTNFSKLSKPEILPVYNRKLVQIQSNPNSYTIINNSPSHYGKKVLMVVGLKKKNKNSIIVADNDFACLTSDDINEMSSHHTGFRIVCFKEKKVNIKEGDFKEILVLEYEVHDNAEEKNFINEDMVKFYYYENPLLNIKGLRLINYVQFKL